LKSEVLWADILIALLLSLVAAMRATDAFGHVVLVNTPESTRFGATIVVPAGWSFVSDKKEVVITAPELDTHVAIIELNAKAADAAVAAAWAIYQIGTQRTLRLSEPRPPSNGWEERRYYEYETSPIEKAMVHVFAWRLGKVWTVSILEASTANYQKREAELSLLLGSLHARGYQRENFAGKRPHPLDTKRIAKLRDFVEIAMRDLGVPGAALGLVDGGKIVFLQGFGLRALGGHARVDADTLFMAASNTKALTTLLLAELVDEHKLRWDEPVTLAYLPFKLGTPETTRQVLIKHLVCACTGLPQQNLEWLFNYGVATPDSSFDLLATMQPTSGFGEVYQYSNLMAAAAGYVAAHVVSPEQELGVAYDNVMRRKVFAPLHMDRTTFDFEQAQRDNFASPHGEDIDGQTALARMDINHAVIPVRPAGGVWTSARDLSRYVQMELAEGLLPNGKRLVLQRNLDARRLPQISTGEDESYGMGLVVNRKYGIPVIDHGGSQFGYKSDMFFLPDQGVGAVLLTNADAGIEMPPIFLRKLIEILYDAKPEAEQRVAIAAANRRTEVATEHAGLVVPPDPTAMAQLAHKYISGALGELDVHAETGAVTFDFGKWYSRVASRKNSDGTTSFVTIDPTVDGYEFQASQQNGRAILTIRDAQHEYTYSSRDANTSAGLGRDSLN
jgi:CubicO group peptidase (beta-lactamase class C family)